MRLKKNKRREQAQARREIVAAKLRRLAEVDAMADTANQGKRKRDRQIDALLTIKKR